VNALELSTQAPTMSPAQPEGPPIAIETGKPMINLSTAADKWAKYTGNDGGEDRYTNKAPSGWRRRGRVRREKETGSSDGTIRCNP